MNLIILLSGQNWQHYHTQMEAVTQDPDYAPFHPRLLRFPDGSSAGSVSTADGMESGEEWMTEELRQCADDSLILCDHPAKAEKLYSRGLPVVGYLPGNEAASQGVQFHHVPYVLAQTGEIEPDSYMKIFQRLHHLPWTITVTRHCIVREFTAEDLPGIYELYNDEEAQQFLQGPGSDYRKEQDQLEAYIDKAYGLYGYGYWAVVPNNNVPGMQDDTNVALNKVYAHGVAHGRGDIIGCVGFSLCQSGSDAASFGYLIRADLRRQGLAYEVCCAVLDFARQNLFFPRIEARTDKKNIPSRTLLARLGFSRDRADGRDEIWVL